MIRITGLALVVLGVMVMGSLIWKGPQATAQSVLGGVQIAELWR